MIAAVAWGASGVLAKLIDLDGLALVGYRFGLSTVAFFLFMAGTGRLPSTATFIAALPGGLALAADVAFFFSAVKLTTVANATVISALQPLVMMYLSTRLLGEQVDRRQVGWSSLAVVGVGVLIFGSSGLPQWSLTGDLLAFGALFAWTGYMFFSKATQDRVNPLEYTFITGLTSAVICTPLAVVFGQDLSWPDGRNWALLGAMAFGSGILAHLVMNWSLTRIPVWLGSTLTLLVPVAATTMAWLWLDEPLTLTQAVGIGLTLVALGAVALRPPDPAGRTGGEPARNGDAESAGGSPADNELRPR